MQRWQNGVPLKIEIIDRCNKERQPCVAPLSTYSVCNVIEPRMCAAFFASHKTETSFFNKKDVEFVLVYQNT